MDYPIGIQTFEEIINNKFFYVDKTDLVYEIARIKANYFLSRPRRFGKSLLLSTLEAYFLGKKKLFKNLKLMKKDKRKKWEKYPVFHFDLNSENYNNEKALDIILDDYLSKWEDIYGKRETEKTLARRFNGLIERAYQKTGKQVVVLVDEYDKPLFSTLDNQNLNDHFREQLKAFYGVIKSSDQYIRFSMFTGVTKFSGVSIFSDLNFFKDISMRKDFQAICGITDKELDKYCHESIEELAEANDTDFADMREQLRQKYDGYHFCQNGIGIYNPYSLINAFDAKELDYYWFETGTPTFLTVLLKNSNIPIERLTGGLQTKQQLKEISNFHQNPLPIMYQSGYLTIKGFDDEAKALILDFPNEEVETGFIKALVPTFLKTINDSPVDTRALIKDINTGKAEDFMKRLQTLFANLDYSIAGELEIYFHNSLCLIFWLLGLETRTERHTSDGRMDATVETKDYVYIFEIKLDGSVDEAMKQIEEKNYAAPFALSGKKIFKIGVNFSKKTRGIGEWKVE